VKGILKLIVLPVLLVAGFASGFTWRDIWAGRPPSGEIFGKLVKGEPAKKQSPVEIFRDNFGYIQANFRRAVPSTKLKHSAMAGMFASLGDPHTSFLEPVAADRLKLETRGDFVGIGARLAPDPLGARIATVFKNAPADRAGVKSGDTIIAVDGANTAGMPTDEIVSKIRGKEATTVEVKVIRPKQPDPIVFKIKRAVVVIPTAEGKMLEGTTVGYVNVSQFAETTVQQFEQALRDVMARKPTGLVIDMRGNPGGLLQTASELLGRFVENKVVVKMKMRGQGETFASTPTGKTLGIKVPIVVLINEESASAAEIFAGVLQDYQRATLVGEHTYGKASVQNVFSVVDQASAKITIARYYLPSGRDISRKVDEDGEYLSGGIAPDIVKALDLNADTLLGDPKKDSQLAKAIEVIASKTR
jgi:carboxyl-terminal processing protease